MAVKNDEPRPATNDAYTGMLAISLLALIAGCVFLYLDYSQYPDSKGPTVPKAPPIVAPAGKGEAPPAVEPKAVEPKVEPKAAEPKAAEPKAAEPKAEEKKE